MDIIDRLNIADMESQQRCVGGSIFHEAATEIDRLRTGIKNYLDGDWEPKIAKMDKCHHGLYGYEDCGQCIDEYFQRLIAT